MFVRPRDEIVELIGHLLVRRLICDVLPHCAGEQRIDQKIAVPLTREISTRRRIEIEAGEEGSAQRAVIKAEALKRSPTDEWSLQRNYVQMPESGLTAAKAKADYAAARDEVRALNAEDGGSAYFWKMPRSATSAMGASAR